MGLQVPSARLCCLRIAVLEEAHEALLSSISGWFRETCR